MRTLHWALAAVTLPVLAGTLTAAEPGNQQLADGLASHYRSSGVLKSYAIDIEANDGVVTLTGTVANRQQWASALQMTSTYPGVKQVVDNLQISEAAPQAHLANYGAPAGTPLMLAQGQAAPIEAVPSAPVGEMAPTAVMPPAPTYAMPPGIVPYADAPVLPPYSWPAYTPYNNYASMAYQTQYPAGAWPFIGPPHPYPMIPSGWRSVSLKWKKGYWWMKFDSH